MGNTINLSYYLIREKRLNIGSESVGERLGHAWPWDKGTTVSNVNMGHLTYFASRTTSYEDAQGEDNKHEHMKDVGESETLSNVCPSDALYRSKVAGEPLKTHMFYTSLSLMVQFISYLSRVTRYCTISRRSRIRVKLILCIHSVKNL